MKTSSRLALSFTLISTGILLVFGIIINMLFFSSRYSHEYNNIRGFRRNPRNAPFERVKIFNKADVDKLNLSHTRITGIVQHEDLWLMIKENKKGQTLITNITPMIDRQLSLARLTLALIIAGSIVSGLLSRRFARRSLRDIYTVADRTQSLDIHSLKNTLSLPHLPHDDEIQTIVTALNTTTTKLHDQISQIKRFIGNLSHEIKTPLTTTRTTAELALKTHNHEQGLHTTIQEIDHINRLVNTLTTIHSTDHQPLTQCSIPFEKLYHDIQTQVVSVHTDHPHIQSAIESGLTIQGDQGAREIIIRNLLDNAYKYTPADGYITLTADRHHISIHNTNSSLTPSELNHIREPLRQADSSKSQDQGFGLGLTLVRTLIHRMGHTIQATQDDSGIAFTITLSQCTSSS